MKKEGGVDKTKLDWLEAFCYEMVEDVERKKKWEEDEVFAVFGERVHLAVYIRTQEGEEGAPSSSKAAPQ